LIVVPPKGLPFPEETHKIVRIFVFKSFLSDGGGREEKKKETKRDVRKSEK